MCRATRVIISIEYGEKDLIPPRSGQIYFHSQQLASRASSSPHQFMSTPLEDRPIGVSLSQQTQNRQALSTEWITCSLYHLLLALVSFIYPFAQEYLLSRFK